MSMPSPCALCVPWEADMACCDEWAQYPEDLTCRSTVLAWDTLRILTGGRVGNCPVVMRPCLTAPCNWCSVNWLQPQLRGGEWYNACGCAPECSCTRLCEIVFPGPVAMVTNVNFGGIALGTDLFRLDNGNRLVRVDGECWPSCQDMAAPLGAPGTLGIVYVPGIVPDAAGLWAAGVLACEFAKACSGVKCRLPSSVTSIARQGVAMTMAGTMFEGGLTGIREVDAYLTAVNPSSLTQPSVVWSPDVPWAGHRWVRAAGPGSSAL